MRHKMQDYVDKLVTSAIFIYISKKIVTMGMGTIWKCD